MPPTDDFPLVLERLSRILQNETHAAGLKPVQWEALRYLARANRFSRSPSAVTGYLGITKGTVSQTLNALERKGLVRKTTAAGDRRNVTLEVTEAGRNLLRDDPIESLSVAATGLPPDARDEIADGLRAVLRQLLERRQQRAFGLCRTCRFFEDRAPTGTPRRCALLDQPLSGEDGELICAEHTSPYV